MSCGLFTKLIMKKNIIYVYVCVYIYAYTVYIDTHIHQNVCFSSRFKKHLHHHKEMADKRDKAQLLCSVVQSVYQKLTLLIDIFT